MVVGSSAHRRFLRAIRRNALLTHSFWGCCVFLPAAGYRNGSSVNNTESNGNYWSSSPNPSNANNARNVNFNSGNLNPQNNNNRYNGQSVRLVRPVEHLFLLDFEVRE